ncbi:hypothetical protein [Roseisolibacter sp. H3M3-2]|uniref:hypothetical protein n=1 Tax=Roseisolibacter sp. H3M3-2 TaxID=3031323 RepID=UPI0023DC8547|nr:hypothetical protein [Roseisolibacter sp. H3M3-2]MDF1504391.1 hypothetical protein [Roseisolibacter sp. H3M3-2]
MLVMLVVHFTPGAWALLPFAAIPAYAWRSLRVVYGGAPARTALKLALLLGAYGVALVTALSVLGLGIVWFVLT